MKHVLILIVGILIGLGLFFGISALQGSEVPETDVTEGTTTTEPTEIVTEPNLILEAEPWDEDGVLRELLLNIPNAWKFSNCTTYGDCLLYYGYDNNVGSTETLDMAVVDPVTGEVHGTTA